MECPKRVWIVYASQTGKSERLCYNVRDELWRVGVVGYPTSIDKFERVFFDFFEETCPESISKKLELEFPLVIFILSTTGQGQVPDMMVSFWNRFLQNNLNSDLIRRLDFAIFGMGDRCFGNERFNITARKLRHLLLSYGANERIPWGLGDESHDFGILGEYDPWIESIIRMYETSGSESRPCHLPIKPAYQYRSVVRSFSPENDEGCVGYEFEVESENELRDSILIQKKHLVQRNIFSPSIVSVVHSQECDKESKTRRIKKIRFGLSDENRVHYTSGTHVAIWPVNPTDKVLQFIQLFNKQVHPKTIIRIIVNEDYYKCWCGGGDEECQYGSSSGYSSDILEFRRCYVKDEQCSVRDRFPIGEEITLFTLISRYLDIMSIPDRRFVNISYQNAVNEVHKDRLREMVQKNVDSKKDYCDYIRDEHRNHLELLWDFNSIELGIDDIINSIPVIIPRYYSICNTFDWYRLNLWRYIEYHDYMRKFNSHKMLSLFPEVLFSNIGTLLPAIKMVPKNLPEIAEQYRLLSQMRTRILDRYLSKVKERYLDQMMSEYSNDICDQHIIEVCVDIIEWSTAFNRKIRGLCSGYLDHIQSNSKTLVAFENKMSNDISRELVDPKIPVLLISCGLGITGIISILQERVLRIIGGESDRMNTLVYIGLRYSNVMYPYLDQIHEFSSRMELVDRVQFNISYSRKSPGIRESIFSNEDLVNVNKISSGCYIQSLMLDDEQSREHIIRCILHGYVLVCGSALSMPVEMRETLARILVLGGKFETLDDSLTYIKRLIRYGRYIEETWV
ncbi:NADPH-dependent FMN FAD containing oxidoreductase [Cryptosporidium canis]|uniref:NADPH-dependent FMN FAD containing oxidoreductase n=1 Tax=Cryptosporidium canis TaxID=195482 RepID=A0ABQ8PAQ8_9CRYT|nr:NADPH-dependent FMN FAD containing oxidoreductase [Cryptosporidium canis]